MEAEEIMPEDCAALITSSTMTFGVPPREGAFVKFAKLCAEARLRGDEIPTSEQLCEYFRGLNWHDQSYCEKYAEIYAWLVRAFLYQHGRIDIVPFTMENVDD